MSEESPTNNSEPAQEAALDPAPEPVASATSDPVSSAAPDTLDRLTHYFSRPDAILEPDCASKFHQFVEAGGSVTEAVQLLSDNYGSTAQLVNFMAESMIYLDCDVESLQNLVEGTMKDSVVKLFDQSKCDSIFMSERATPAWVAELIAFPVWRNLIYELAEHFPDCLFLNFAIKLICDTGFQDEIRKSVKVVSQQHDVFTKVLYAAIGTLLTDGTEQYETNLEELAQLACHAEHTYLYTQALLAKLAIHEKIGSNLTLKRVMQDLQHVAMSKFEPDIIIVGLMLSASYPPPFALLATDSRPDVSDYFTRQQQVISAVRSMTNRGSVNPADMLSIFEAYTKNQQQQQPQQSASFIPPPIGLIRQLEFIDIVVDHAFKPGAKVNPEYRSKYFFILGYAATVTFDPPAPQLDAPVEHVSTRRSASAAKQPANPEELATTRQFLERLYLITSENRPLSELLPELNQLLQLAKNAAVGFAMLSWLKAIFSDPNFFMQNSDQSPPLHYVLLDELATLHSFLHGRILDILIKLFESSHIEDDLDVIIQLQVRKRILDRFVHLFSRGCVLPVLRYVRKWWAKLETDASIVRYFVGEIIDIIAPPYSMDFVLEFFPLVEDEQIAIRNYATNHEQVDAFLEVAKSMLNTPAEQPVDA